MFDNEENLQKFKLMRKEVEQYRQQESYSNIKVSDITDQHVKYVFQQAKEEVHRQQSLKTGDMKSSFDMDLKYQSIIQDENFKTINNQMMTSVNKIQKLLDDPTALEPIEDPFGIKRGLCTFCLDECGGYAPSYSELNTLPSVCVSCKCGATSHQLLQLDSNDSLLTSIKNDILPLLNTPTLTDNDLNFKPFLVLFSYDTAEIGKSQINNFMRIITEGGFTILQSDVRTINLDNQNQNLKTLQNTFVVQDYDEFKNNVNDFYQGNILDLERDEYDNQINKFASSSIFFKNLKKSNNKNTTFEKINKLSTSQTFLIKNETKDLRESLDQNEERNFNKTKSILKESNYKTFKNQMANKLHSSVNFKQKYLETFKKPVLLLCLKCSKQNDGISYFEKFYQAIKNNKKLKIPEQLKLIYYSKRKTTALWDVQATFPNLFKIKSSISLIMQKPDLFSHDFSKTFNPNATFNSFLMNTNMNYLNKSAKSRSGEIYIQENDPNDQQIERETEFTKNLSIYKDVLFRNSTNIISLNHFKKVSILIEHLNKHSNDKTNFIHNLINYISSNKETDENKSVSICLSADIQEKETSFSSVISDKLDILNFKSEIEKEILSSIFFPLYSSYNRVLILLRPFIVRNGLSDAILNIFKLNDFFILKRKSQVLTKLHLNYLYHKEFPNENKLLSFEDYAKLMSDFNVEIVVLSKFGAKEESKVICGNAKASFETEEEEYFYSQNQANLNKSLGNIFSHIDLKVEYDVDNDLIHKDENIKKKKWIENLFMNNHNTNTTNSNTSFNNLSSLINLSKIFSEIINEKKKNKIYEDFNALSEIKHNIIKFFSNFNVYLYNSDSEEEIRFFFPEFGVINESIVLLKNVCGENKEDIQKSDDSLFDTTRNKFSSKISLVNENIKLTFERMNYEILDCVDYKLTEDEYGNIFDNFLTSNRITPYEYSNAKNVMTNSGVQLLRMVKTGGALDLRKIIGKENVNILNISKQDPQKFNKFNLAKENCYLFTLDSEVEYFYPLVNDKISIIEGGYLLIKSLSDESNIIGEVLNSCLKNTVGEFMRNDNFEENLIKRYLKFYHYDDENKINEYFLKVLEDYMFSKWKINSQYSNSFEFLHMSKHTITNQISFFTESSELGFYEVRIPILESEVLDDTYDLQIASHYHFIDEQFYSQIPVKYSAENIMLDSLPFLENEGEEWIHSWMDKHFGLIIENNPEVNLLVDKFPNIQRRLFYKTKFESTKLFYMMCSTLNDGGKLPMAPSTYHYRIKPEDITMDIKRIWVTEEFAGLSFIEVVAQDFLKYRQSEVNKKTRRHSLPSFLWGRQLARICKRLETTNGIAQSVANSGPLFYCNLDESLKGVVNPKFFLQYQQYLYINILYDLKDEEIGNEEQFKLVESKVLQILNSEAFIKSRHQDNITLTPTRLKDRDLRISKRKTNEDTVYSNDREIKFHQYFKKNEEDKLIEEIANKNVMMIDLFLEKSSKYKYYASILFLLNIQFKKLNRKSFLVEGNEEEYDELISSLVTGFNNNIDLDSPEVNDRNKLNSYKIEYFLYVLSEIKYMLNEKEVMLNRLKILEEKLNFTKGRKKTNSENVVNNISILKNNISETNINIEILFFELVNYDFTHVILKNKEMELIVLPKERYHIPMFIKENVTQSVDTSKYIFKKVLDKSYMMDIDVVRALSKATEREVFSLGSFRSTKNQFTVIKNHLREPEKEASKEIIIKKVKANKRLHPIKIFADLIKKQNNL